MSTPPAPTGTDSSAVRIGALVPLTRPGWIEAGRHLLAGLELGARYVNEAGGIGGRPLELVVRDTAADPSRAVAAVDELAHAGVVALAVLCSRLLGLDVAVLSELDHPDAESVGRAALRPGGTAAITRGARGATLIRGNERSEISAVAAREIDPTGAGDVFGVVLTLELAAGKSPLVAGRAAAAAAARVVEGPGLGTLTG